MDTLKKLIKKKYLTLVPTNESKKELKNMKNCGVNQRFNYDSN